MKAAILGMGAMGQIHKQVYESMGIEVFTYDPKYEPGWILEACDPVAVAIYDADIVSVCSPDNFHAEQIIAAFHMGKHVFCEKPLCHTREEFEAIKAAYNKGALGMNFPLRWHRPFLEAKQRLPDLGKIQYVHAHYEYGRLHKMIDGWRGDMNYSVVMGGGIHFIDLMLWLGFEMTPCKAARGERQSAAILDLSGGGLFALTCDFTALSGHARRLCIEGTKNNIVINDREPTDKGRALREFLYHLRGGSDDHQLEVDDVPRASDIFRVHEIGLSL